MFQWLGINRYLNKMKQLVNEITGRKDFPAFNGTNEQIRNWIESNLDRFDLNEGWSCSVELEDNKITIDGDEDLHLFVIEDLDIIKF